MIGNILSMAISGIALAAFDPVPLTYTVVKGDSLSLITKRLRGDFREWPALFRENKELLREWQVKAGKQVQGDPDPNLIYPGMVLRTPAEWHPAAEDVKVALGPDLRALLIAGGALLSAGLLAYAIRESRRERIGLKVE